jgi:hypothetical protein
MSLPLMSKSILTLPGFFPHPFFEPQASGSWHPKPPEKAPADERKIPQPLQNEVLRRTPPNTTYWGHDDTVIQYIEIFLVDLA